MSLLSYAKKQVVSYMLLGRPQIVRVKKNYQFSCDSCIHQLLSITHEIYKSFDDGLEVLEHVVRYGTRDSSKTKWYLRKTV